jgi:hypothetical protein
MNWPEVIPKTVLLRKKAPVPAVDHSGAGAGVS